MRAALVLVLPWLLGGCAIGLGKSLHQVSAQQAVDEATLGGTARAVTVEKKQTVILGLTTDFGFVDQAYAELIAQCPGGELVNVMARHSTDLGFLAYESKLLLRASCVTGATR